MKSRTFYSAIAFIAGLLVVVGAFGFWRLTAHNPRSLITKGGQETPLAAQFVPRQSPLMVSLLARPDELWQLRQVLTPAKNRFAARREWQSLKETLNDWVGWDYDTDLRPWLDRELTLAVTDADIDHDSSNGQQAGYLVVLGCQDGEKAREALHLLWQKRAASGRHLVFDTVSGVPVIYDQAPTNSTIQGLAILSATGGAIRSLATATVGDRYVLIANRPQVLQEAITTFQAPDVSLAKAANYRESIRTLPANRIGWLYANMPPLMVWLGLEDDAAPGVSPPAGRRASALFMSFRAFSAGLIGDTTLTPAPGTAFPVTPSHQEFSTQALKLLPANTLFATSGQDLSQLLETLKTNVGGYNLTQRSLMALLKSLSLPTTALPAELLAATQGEYAVGILPGSPSTWLLLTKTKETGSFSAIDTLVQAQGINVSHVQLDDQDITAWTRLSLMRTAPDSAIKLNTQVVGVHTKLQGYDILANSLAGLQQVIQQDGSTSLLQQPAFAQLPESLSKQGQTFTFIDWPRLAPALNRQFPWLRVLEEAGQPLTAHLGPLVLWSYDSTLSLQEGALAIKLLENPQ